MVIYDSGGFSNPGTEIVGELKYVALLQNGIGFLGFVVSPYGWDQPCW
jgi:hypothetical protein